MGEILVVTIGVIFAFVCFLIAILCFCVTVALYFSDSNGSPKEKNPPKD